MQFKEQSIVSHPASAILETMIERMEEIVPFLPNIESIETKESKKLKNGQIRIIRHWQGKADTIPTAIRPFISRDVLGWIDTATWTPSEYKVEWQQSALTPGVARLYECSGENYFEPNPDDPRNSSRIRILGKLDVHPDRLPGLPTFVGRTLAPQIEKFIIGMITPNLRNLAAGLQGYLDHKSKGGRKKK